MLRWRVGGYALANRTMHFAAGFMYLYITVLPAPSGGGVTGEGFLVRRRRR